MLNAELPQNTCLSPCGPHGLFGKNTTNRDNSNSRNGAPAAVTGKPYNIPRYVVQERMFGMTGSVIKKPPPDPASLPAGNGNMVAALRARLECQTSRRAGGSASSPGNKEYYKQEILVNLISRLRFHRKVLPRSPDNRIHQSRR
jgi:hypothetical protein